MKPLPGSGCSCCFLLNAAISYALTSRFATPVGVEERKTLRGLKFSQFSKYKRLRKERKYTKGTIGGLYNEGNKHSCCVAAMQPRIAFAPGRLGPRIFRRPAQNPRLAPHHGAGQGTLATEQGRAGPLFLPPGSFPVPEPRFLRGPAQCTVCILSLICQSRLFFYGFSKKKWSFGVR